MREKSNSSGFKWFLFFALIAAAIPMSLAWWNVNRDTSTPSTGIDPALASATEIELQLRPSTDDAALVDLGRKVGGAIRWNSPVSRDETHTADLTLAAGSDPKTVLETLRADSRVEAADVAHIYTEPEDLTGSQPDLLPSDGAPDTGRWKPNDPRYKEQWNFQMVHAEEAWEVTKGKGVIVAVIDTGVASKDSKKGGIGKDFKETQFVPGYDFVNKDDNPYDDHGHGTHVAGTIAESTDNGEGVAGLAFEAKIMPLKVLSAFGGGRVPDIADAIRWAADHGANVINMSLGGPMPDSVMASACEYAHKKGVTIVCAAGNSGREGVGYPAAYKDCIAVSSVGPKGDLSFFSSWGRQVAIAAPGGDKNVGGDAGGIIQNTVMQGQNGPENDYFSFQGTSMASPHVAAVAALIFSKGVTKPDEVKAILQKSAVKKGPEVKYGAGILNAAQAVKLAEATHDDGMARVVLVVLLFTGCFIIGHFRKKSGNGGAPFWGTAALSFGLLFPDWLTSILGQTSAFNLVGHSILIPGALLVLGASGKNEKRLLGMMSLGLLMHIGWEFLHSTSPFGPEIGFWQLLPWVSVNMLAGFSIFFSGLGGSRE